MKWKVKYVAKGMEPPYPFGLIKTTIEAESRASAIAKTIAENSVSSAYRVSASPIRPQKCRYCKNVNLANSLGEIQCRDCKRYQK
jgi:hypothetical protein